jgi:DHA3 family macrolide efflux protein-like MFS transporter
MKTGNRNVLPSAQTYPETEAEMSEMNSEKTGKNSWMKKFLPIWSAQIFSLLGSGLVQFALVWYLTKETGSATILAMATFVAVIPDVLIGPFAGALVDRWNRRVVMIVSDAVIAVVTLGLAVLFAFDLVQVWHIFVVLFLRETGAMFHWPAMQASTSLMVPEEHLSRVAGINQALRGGLNIIAPPLGALLMTFLQFYQVISVDVLTAIIAITPLLFIRIPQPVRKDHESAVTVKLVLSDMAEGFKFMKTWPGILMLTLVAALLNFFLAPSGTFMSLLVTQHFMKGVWELSILESCIGFGVVGGGLLLGVWGGFKKKIVTSMIGVIGLGLGVLLVGIAPADAFYIAVIGTIVLGVMNPIANGPLQAIMQSKIPPEMQGRVMGLLGAICTGMMPLSMLVSAPIANAFGLRFWYWIGGVITVVIGVGAFFMPRIMNLEDQEIKGEQVVIAVS